MKVTFIGVGSADDKYYPNTSIYIESKKAKILLDCGVTVAFQLFQRDDILLDADAIYISHRHADHFFGLPLLLLRMKNIGRKKPLTIFGYYGVEKFVREGLVLGISTLFKDISKLPYVLEFRDFDKKFEMFDLQFELAQTTHFDIVNMAIKIIENGKSFVYSGDGMFTDETRKLYNGVDLLIHESFLVDQAFNGHAMALDLIKMSKEENVKALALVHFKDSVRQTEMDKLKKLIKKEKINVFVPEPGAILMI